MNTRENVIVGLNDSIEILNALAQEGGRYTASEEEELLESVQAFLQDALAFVNEIDVTPEELERLKKCRHECKIDCLLEQYERVKAERDALLEEKEYAAKTVSDGWISVEDMLPHERDTIFSELYGTDKWRDAMFRKMSNDVRVICVFADGSRMVWHDHTVDGKWNSERFNKVPKRRITHWMKNPELPEEV